MPPHSYKFVLNHIITCLRKAENNESNINDDILNYHGMSGYKTRHFYNNICSLPNCRYLEIGTYHGSSSISAIYKNQIEALFIDNWSLFNGNKEIFYDAVKKYNTGSSYRVIDNDCWKININEIDNKFNVYLYDGGHEYEDHYKAISKFYTKLEENCIVLVDDWNWEAVRNGTMNAFNDLNINVKFKYEIFTPEPHYELGVTNWWNGIGVFIIGSKDKIILL
jgi:hypothetical protein